jgi:hypothetical protein
MSWPSARWSLGSRRGGWISMRFLSTWSWQGGELTWGSFGAWEATVWAGGGGRLLCSKAAGGGAIWRFSGQGERQNGCDVVCSWLALGRWCSRGITHGAVMKGENLGFASVFYETPARGSSIYRGFGSMISCTCRTPSPTHLIWLGFDFNWIPLRSFGRGRKFHVRFRYLTRGRRWLNSGRARTGGEGEGNWAEVGSAREKRKK